MPRSRRFFGIIIPIVTITVFAAFLISALVKLATLDKNLRIEATQNMLWVLSRAQVSSYQLQEAAMLRTLGQREQAEVDQALITYLGHFNVLNDGPQRREMDRLRFSNVLDQVELQQKQLAELSSNIAIGETEKTSKINAILAPYNAMLVRAANKAMVFEWEKVGSKLDYFRQQLATIGLSLAMIFIAGIGMTWNLVHATRTARTRNRLLERERAFSQLLIESSSEAIIAVDTDYNCTIWNEPASFMFGMSAEEAMKQPAGITSGIFCPQKIKNIIGQVLNGQSQILTDQVFIRQPGTAPRYLDLRFFPLRDGSTIIGAILIILDNTQQHAARRALSQRRDYLEEEVMKRTQQLNAALSRERAATDVYRNFAAMISHQFRTPLAIADSALQRLVRRAGNIEASELIERGNNARNAIARLVSLLESTLNVARLDAGPIEQNLTVRPLGQVAQEALQRQQEDTPDRHFILTEQATSPARLDPVHTEHIILNLLANAAKYAPAGSAIHIIIGQSHDHAYCTVISAGHIPPHDQQQLFARYFRGSSAREKSGAGIGLYLAKNLARLQDGDVTFEERSAQEIAFTLTLPLADKRL